MLSTDLIPFVPDVAELAAEISVPHSTNHEQGDTDVGECDSEEPSPDTQALHAFVGAVSAVLGCIHDAVILHQMAHRVGEHQQTTNETQNKGTIHFPSGAKAPLALTDEKDGDTNNNGTSQSHSDHMASCASRGSDGTADKRNYEGRPASGTNQSRDGHDQRKQRTAQRSVVLLRGPHIIVVVMLNTGGLVVKACHVEGLS